MTKLKWFTRISAISFHSFIHAWGELTSFRYSHTQSWWCYNVTYMLLRLWWQCYLISLRDTGLVRLDAVNDRVKELKSCPQLLQTHGFEHELSRSHKDTEAPIPVEVYLHPPEHLDNEPQPHGVPCVLGKAVHTQQTEVLLLLQGSIFCKKYRRNTWEFQ